MARFLEAAAERAEWISVEAQGDILILTAADERDQVARLTITTNPTHILEYSDEWGLLGG
jgi:hypothetical protein